MGIDAPDVNTMNLFFFFQRKSNELQENHTQYPSISPHNKKVLQTICQAQNPHSPQDLACVF